MKLILALLVFFTVRCQAQQSESDFSKIPLAGRPGVACSTIRITRENAPLARQAAEIHLIRYKSPKHPPTVLILDTHKVARKTHTNADGLLGLGGLKPGSYSIEVPLKDGWAFGSVGSSSWKACVTDWKVVKSGDPGVFLLRESN